jgi:uncharacterized protein (TIGR03435 family)
MNQRGMRSLTATKFWKFTLLLVPALAQTPQICEQAQAHDSEAKLAAFEVVSIRGHKPGYWPTFERKEFTPVGLNWINVLPQTLITFAYDLRDPKLQVGLIPGAPKWIRSEWYEVRAKMSEADVQKLKNASSTVREAYMRQMIQSLLADRFNLKAHLVSKEGLTYELVVANNGLKSMRAARADEPPGIDAIDSGDLQYHNTPLSALLLIRPQMLGDAPVVDKTGLTGNYDFELKWDRDPNFIPGAAPLAPSPADGSRPSIFKALEVQLGLKLVPVRTPIKGIVIDHIEQPSPN